jgi:hypothetical protein
MNLYINKMIIRSKKSVYTFAMCLAAFTVLTSCGDDYLDTTSKSTLTAGTAQSQKQAQQELIGCYDGYQTVFGYGNVSIQLASEVMSDNCFAGGGTGDNTNYESIDRFDKGYVANNNILESTWKLYYSAINRCNTLIQSENTTEWNDSTTKKNVLGQARALRAMCYFDLVRLFGSVPLLTTPSVAKAAEAKPADIFELIASDLKYAADNISLGAYSSSWADSNKGLISEWAAKALLARVYLFYTGFYKAELSSVTKSEVLAGLEDIINKGGFSLVDDFSTLWPCSSRTAAASTYTWATDKYAGESNKEVLFAVEFDSSTDQDASINSVSVSTNNNGFICMSSIRNFYKAPYGKGWGVCTVNPKLWTAYSSDDTRRVASIISMDNEKVTSQDGWDDVTDWREYTGYVQKKYSVQCYYDGKDNCTVENSSASFQYNQGQDYIIMRYADVLLMAAELGSANAQTYYNMVRDRAFGDTNHRKDVNEDNILEERRLEFAFEGQRYWDLLRVKGLSGAASILASNQSNVSVKDGTASGTVSVSSANVINKGGLCQKPYNQITLMGSDYLTQNSGW